MATSKKTKAPNNATLSITQKIETSTYEYRITYRSVDDPRSHEGEVTSYDDALRIGLAVAAAAGVCQIGEVDAAAKVLTEMAAREFLDGGTQVAAVRFEDGEPWID